MARSAEALQRRALKRNRTVPEQKVEDAKKAKQLKHQKQVAQAAGSWKCPACQTQNFASRYICHSKTCQEPKPESAKKNEKRPPKEEASPPPSKRPRKDDNGSATPGSNQWSKPQASPCQIEYNQSLRQRLEANDPTLTVQELERARILVARSQRKKQQKRKPPPKVVDSPTKSEELPLSSSKDQRKRNKALLKRFKNCKGEGMKEADVVRAKQLLARKERKKSAMHVQQHGEKSEGSSQVEEEDGGQKRETVRVEKDGQVKNNEPNNMQKTNDDQPPIMLGEPKRMDDEEARKKKKEKKAKKKERKEAKKKEKKTNGKSSSSPMIDEPQAAPQDMGIVSDEETPKKETKAKKEKKSKKEKKPKADKTERKKDKDSDP